MNTMTTKPTTLAAAIAEQEATRIASNLTNLASAYTTLGEELDRKRAEIAGLEAIRTEILTMGERDPTSITLEETKALFKKAMGR